MTSATEATLCSVVYNGTRNSVHMDYFGRNGPQATTNPIANIQCYGGHSYQWKGTKPKRTRAIAMRFYWLRDQECQEQFRIYWRPNKLNYTDYWTKHHL